MSSVQPLTPGSVQNQKAYTAPVTEIWAWGFGAMASHFLIQTFAQANRIFTIGFGIDPVILGWAMMLPRFVDALADPYLGHLSDNTHTRWGRRKPYLVIGAVIGSLFLMSMWWADPNWSKSALLIYLGTFGTLTYICYGLYTMAYTAVGYELTDDYNERSRVAAVGAYFLAIVALIVSWLFKISLMPIFGVTREIDGKIVGDPIIGMRWLSAGICVLIIFSALVAARFCRERFTKINREHTPLFAALKTTLHNRPFVILLLIKICQLFGERLSGALLGFVAIYYVCRGDKSLGTGIEAIGGTIGTIWYFLLLPFLKSITKNFGKRAAMILGSLIALAAAGAQPFIMNPDYPYLMLIPALVVAPLSLIAGTIANAVVPDICDLDELQTGERREGLFTAVMGFMAKMEISLCTLISGYVVVWTGLDVKLSGAQPDEVLSRLYWIAIIPNVIFTVGAFVLTLMFPMNEKMMLDVRKQLDERRKIHTVTSSTVSELTEPVDHVGLEPANYPNEKTPRLARVMLFAMGIVMLYRIVIIPFTPGEWYQPILTFSLPIVSAIAPLIAFYFSLRSRRSDSVFACAWTATALAGTGALAAWIGQSSEGYLFTAIAGVLGILALFDLYLDGRKHRIDAVAPEVVVS